MNNCNFHGTIWESSRFISLQTTVKAIHSSVSTFDVSIPASHVARIRTGSSFSTGIENTIQVSKFKRIGLKKMADFDGGDSVSVYSIINLH